MNTIIWILQGLMAFTFLYSGLCKSMWSERKLVTRGQTGVEGLPSPFIKFIGVSEIFGAAGLVIPMSLNVASVLTPVAAVCLAFIMPFAAVIHYRRREPKNVATNVALFAVCIVIAISRF